MTSRLSRLAILDSASERVGGQGIESMYLDDSSSSCFGSSSFDADTAGLLGGTTHARGCISAASNADRLGTKEAEVEDNGMLSVGPLSTLIEEDREGPRSR